MPLLHLENRTGYHVGDLAHFFARGLRAMGCQGVKVVRVIESKEPNATMDRRSRGIAYIGRCRPGERCAGSSEAKSIVLMLPPPERLTLRRLARLFEHEVKHTRGKEHDDMTRREFWSLGGVPGWARGAKIRYAGGRVLK
jgi:hypothetical protein